MSLTIEEKRDRLHAYCENTNCQEKCELRNWEGKTIYPDGNDGNLCLFIDKVIDKATEEELDKALELINNTKIKPLEDSKIEKHKLICQKLNAIYKFENEDYGDSFGKSYKEYGLTMSCMRLEDKLNKLKSLNSSKNVKITGKSIEDTLMDLANYAIMTLIELDGEE